MPLLPNLNTYVTNRLLVYLGAALFVSAGNEVGKIVDGSVPLETPIHYIYLSIKIITPVIIALGAFMDQSLSKREP